MIFGQKDSRPPAGLRTRSVPPRLKSRRGQTLAEYALILALLGSGILYASARLMTSVDARLVGGVVVQMGHGQSGAEILKKK